MKSLEQKVEVELFVIEMDIIQRALDQYQPADDGEKILMIDIEKKIIEAQK